MANGKSTTATYVQDADVRRRLGSGSGGSGVRLDQHPSWPSREVVADPSSSTGGKETGGEITCSHGAG